MEPLVIVAVLAAACAHATWNAITHNITDKLVAATTVGLGGALAAVPILLLAPMPAPRSWPLLAASAALHVAYLLLLMTSYRLGEFSQVYPIARGIAPLLVLAAATIFAGELLDPVRVLGVVVVSAGLASLVFVRRDGQRTRDNLPALAAAIGTGVMIAAYTTVDGIAVRQAGTALGYAGWLLFSHGVAMPVIAFAIRRRRLFAQLRPALTPGLTAGVLSLGAYGLVLWAQTGGPLAPIAALREVSIVVGALIGTIVFGERFGRYRIVATIIVLAGVTLVTIG